ncbi:unnamed protein product [marine sediment metagenome]|uniref:Uncharacterized protein n=1 Tax=marine sediment metagenome TaxID=412755 RepID=X1TMD3_9ZZZZ
MDNDEKLNKIEEILEQGDGKQKSVKVTHTLLFGRWKISTKITFLDRRVNWIKSI